MYEKEKFPILTKEEYIDIVINQLELLRDDIVIHPNNWRSKSF